VCLAGLCSVCVHLLFAMCVLPLPLLLCTIAITLGLASAFANFGLVVSLLGSLSNSALLFGLPTLFYLKLCRPPAAAAATAVPSAAHSSPPASPDAASSGLATASDGPHSLLASDDASSAAPEWLPRHVPLTLDTLPWRFAWLPILVIVVGVLASIIGVYFVIQEMVTAAGTPA
jgi:hypothetical protein